MFGTTWTDEKIEQLKALQAQGLSCAQIANEIGGISRNAVIGKLSRMGLAPGRNFGAQLAARTRAKQPKPPKCERKTGLQFRRMDYQPVAMMELPADESPVCVGFMDLEAHHCRWPIEDKYCGAQKHGEYPYCARHCMMAYRKA